MVTIQPFSRKANTDIGDFLISLQLGDFKEGGALKSGFTFPTSFGAGFRWNEDLR